MNIAMNHPHSSEAPKGFEDFARMVHDTIGVCIPPTKRKMIETRLSGRIRELGFRNTQEYFRHLFEGGGLRAEMRHIEERVTTNKTDFFRETDHFNYLKDVIFRTNQHRNGGRLFKAWSAAASNGAESYTIAMMLAEHAHTHPDFEWGVLGTDISERVLEHARRGIYPGDVISPVPAALRNRYLFEGQNEWRGKWRISTVLRNRVNFRKLNLIKEGYSVDSDIDVIFLRNVLIYFDPDVQLAVLRRVGRHLAPGGHLFVGHSESMVVRMPGFHQVAPAIYRKDL